MSEPAVVVRSDSTGGRPADIGDLVRIGATFKSLAGVLVVPTAVVLTVVDPSDNESTPTVSTPSTGAYQVDVSIDEAGTWEYRWAGTGSYQGAVEHSFFVRKSVVDSP